MVLLRRAIPICFLCTATFFNRFFFSLKIVITSDRIVCHFLSFFFFSVALPLNTLFLSAIVLEDADGFARFFFLGGWGFLLDAVIVVAATAVVFVGTAVVPMEVKDHIAAATEEESTFVLGFCIMVWFCFRFPFMLVFLPFAAVAVGVDAEGWTMVWGYAWPW